VERTGRRLGAPPGRQRGEAVRWRRGQRGSVVERRRCGGANGQESQWLAREGEGKTGRRRHESPGGERPPRGKGVAGVETIRIRGLPNGGAVFTGLISSWNLSLGKIGGRLRDFFPKGALKENYLPHSRI
jgi:hypothetical protein